MVERCKETSREGFFTLRCLLPEDHAGIGHAFKESPIRYQYGRWQYSIRLSELEVGPVAPGRPTDIGPDWRRR